MGHWSTDFPWPNPPHSNYFLFSSSFVVTVGNINFLSLTHTLSLCLSLSVSLSLSLSLSLSVPLARQHVFHLDFSSWPVWGLSYFFFRQCGRMLGWAEVEDLVSQVAVGGQICWQSDRLTHLGHCSAAQSFPPRCIPTLAGATDLLKPLHPPTKIYVIWNIGPQGKQKQRTFLSHYYSLIH